MDRRADMAGAEVEESKEVGMVLGGVYARGAAITGWKMHKLGCCKVELCALKSLC